MLHILIAASLSASDCAAARAAHATCVLVISEEADNVPSRRSLADGPRADFVEMILRSVEDLP